MIRSTANVVSVQLYSWRGYRYYWLRLDGMRGLSGGRYENAALCTKRPSLGRATNLRRGHLGLRADSSVPLKEVPMGSIDLLCNYHTGTRRYLHDLV